MIIAGRSLIVELHGRRGQVFSFSVTLILLIYLLLSVDWQEFPALAGRLALSDIFMAGGIYLALNYFRALRFRALLEQNEIPLRILYPITLYHNFLVRILPFKLGELSYIYLLRTRLRYSAREGIGSLLGARLFELLMIVLVLMLAVSFPGAIEINEAGNIAFWAVSFFIVCALSLYYVGAILRFCVSLLRRIRFPASAERFIRALTLEENLEQIADQMDHFRRFDLFMRVFLLSGFTYGSSFLMNFVLIQGLGIEHDFATMVAIISIGMFAAAFPFSISGFGVVEFGWAFGFVSLAGLSVADAAAIGFLLHGFQIVIATITGFMGYLGLRANKWRGKSSL